jgi:FkbM family methyltransferase
MATLFRGDRPLVFDVGANVGQTVQAFRKAFREPQIYSFEPSPTTFALLRMNTATIPDVHVWNRALGSSGGQMTLQENDRPEMTSFLPLSTFGWGSVIKQTRIEVDTVDDFCREQHIDRIDILKSDTQGYDLEVFKGAERMFQENRIGFVFSEVIFNDMYKNLPPMSQIYDFLISRNFLLVSFYELAYQERLASWTDALFVQRSCVPALAHPTPDPPGDGADQ